MNTDSSPPRFSFEARWSPALKRFGHVQISSFFLKHYSQLKPYPLTYGEAMFVVHLMQYKWDSGAPFPAYGTIADQMKVSTKTAQRWAKSLQDKGYLHREFRRGETNIFHLKKLIAALDAFVVSNQAAPRQRARS